LGNVGNICDALHMLPFGNGESHDVIQAYNDYLVKQAMMQVAHEALEHCWGV
jgi:hypothetical protein